MDNDSPTTPGCKGQPEEERQNRRQFFNGLGKWSLAIIAAVTALRGGLHDLQSAIGSRLDPARPAGANLANGSQRRKNPMGINRTLTIRTLIIPMIIGTIIVVNYNMAERRRVGQVDLWTRRSDAGSRCVSA